MISFRDSANVGWTVFEVRRQVTTKSDSSFLPGSFSDGWLCFESVGAKRRLIKYPDNWRELSDAELEKLLVVAQPAPRPTFRGGDDLGDLTPAREA